MPIRVIEMAALHVRIPLWKRIRHASYTRRETDNLVIRCLLEDGVEGFGEGVPRDYVTGETIDSALALVRRSDLPAQLEPCRDMTDAIGLAERLRLAPIPGDERHCQGNSARCAVELALLDAYGKKFNAPLAETTRLLAPDLFEPHRRVRYSAAITSAQGLKLRFAVWQYRIYGFRHLKVKVAIQGQNDLDRLRIIRSRGGRKLDIRIDANEAWSPDEACARMLELKPSRISAVEQPVAHAHACCLAEFRKHTGVPVVLDESLCSMIDAERALASESCDLFNLRLSKCGGFIPTLRLAQFARQHGLGYQLGCQVGETALLSAAGRQFATSVTGIRYLEGSFDRHLVKEPLSTHDLTFGWGGWAPALSGGGLGVHVDLSALERITVRKELLLG